MEQAIKILAMQIEEQGREFSKVYELFGSGHSMTSEQHNILRGMERAFKAVAGISYWDWWLKQHQHREVSVS